MCVVSGRWLAILALWLLLTSYGLAQSTSPQPGPWYFAVSGDSRNCGDIVMPAIAEQVRKDGALFYWHLGDYRAIYDFDQDFLQTHPKGNISSYEESAWQDFIDRQIEPFGNLPI